MPNFGAYSIVTLIYQFCHFQCTHFSMSTVLSFFSSLLIVTCKSLNVIILITLFCKICNLFKTVFLLTFRLIDECPNFLDIIVPNALKKCLFALNFVPIHYWNDRRSRRVFLCFYLAIFQLTSVKLQTFAYNSRTVWSSFMKFWQQFEINELYVSTKFQGNRWRDFGFRTRKLPSKFGIKYGLSQKRLKYGKKYFIWLYVLRYPFIPTNPLWAAMRFISFFFLIFVRFSSPKLQNMEI